MPLPEDRFDRVDAPELWWLHHLARRLDARRPLFDKYERYYAGDHPLLFASEKFRKAFGGLFSEFASNFMPLVVDAVEERLNVEGFRFGPDAEADMDAWRIWQVNQLDADSQVAHTESLINGMSYAMVWPEDDEPKITVEHPTQTIIGYAAGDRRRRLAALKKWLDDSGHVYATLYLPDNVWKFKSDVRGKNGAWPLASSIRWIERGVAGETFPIDNPLKVVPVVELPNRPRLLLPGQSEIKDAIPLQDAINKELADMLVASEFVAFRQRWVTGYEIPRDPKTNQPIEEFKAAIDRLWAVEDKDVTFGEFGETNLEQYVRVVQDLVQHVATQTRTPPHYFYLKGQMPSGESIKSAETGLVTKARRKMRHFGEGWEEIMRLAFAVKGDSARQDIATVETIWGDPESRTEGEHVDAVMKKKALDVPRKQLWEDLGYSPTQIERFEKMLADDRALLGPAPAPADA